MDSLKTPDSLQIQPVTFAFQACRGYASGTKSLGKRGYNTEALNAEQCQADTWETDKTGLMLSDQMQAKLTPSCWIDHL